MVDPTRYRDTGGRDLASRGIGEIVRFLGFMVVRMFAVAAVFLRMAAAPVAAQDVFSSGQAPAGCDELRQQEQQRYSTRMQALQERERALEEEYRRELAACGLTNHECSTAAQNRHGERMRLHGLAVIDAQHERDKARIDLELACTADALPPDPCGRALAAEDRRYHFVMAQLHKREVDIWNRKEHEESDCHWDSECHAAAHRRAAGRTYDLQAEAAREGELHHQARDDLLRVCQVVADVTPAENGGRPAGGKFLRGAVEENVYEEPGGGHASSKDGREADYARGFTQGVAICLQGVVTLPLHAANNILTTVARLGTHAGYYWEIGAALARGDTAAAKRILDLKTEEDIQNFDDYAKSLPKLVSLDPAAPGLSAQENGARQGALLCNALLLRALSKATPKKAKPGTAETISGGGESAGGSAGGRLGAGQKSGAGANPNAPFYTDDTEPMANPSTLPAQGPLPNCGALSCARVAEVLGKNLGGLLPVVMDRIKPKVRLDFTKGSKQPVEAGGGLTAKEIKDGLGSLGIPATVEEGIGALANRLREGKPVIAGIATTLPGTAGTPPTKPDLHAVVVEKLESRGGTPGVVYWDPGGFYFWQPLATFEKFFDAAGREFVSPL